MEKHMEPYKIQQEFVLCGFWDRDLPENLNVMSRIKFLNRNCEANSKPDSRNFSTS